MDQVKKAVTAAIGELALVRDHLRRAHHLCPPNTPEHFRLLVIRQQASNLEDNIAMMLGEMKDVTTYPAGKSTPRVQPSPQ